MIVELVSTGTELLLGQIVNSNAAWLAKELNSLGFHVLYQTTVGDNRKRMRDVFQIALGRADLIITTGGLGPTQGDITKEVSASLLSRRCYLHQPTVEKITGYFTSRGIKMPESNLRQATLPEDAIVVENNYGTAPGIILEHGNKVIIHLPGPPRELEPMFHQEIKPYLQRRYGSQGVILSRVLRVCGIGESSLEERLLDLITSQTNPTLALLAKVGEIHIRLTAKGTCEKEAQLLISNVERVIRDRVGNYVVGVDDESIEVSVGAVLRQRGFTVALAESCTGGLVTSRLTDIPGSSDYVVGSVVCYSNSIKHNIVGVPQEVLDSYGAVSEETAVNMAQNIRRLFHSHLGVSITGIAGPGGATATKPIGLVYIAIDGPEGTHVFPFQFSGQRNGIKQRTVQAALFELKKYVLSL